MADAHPFQLVEATPADVDTLVSLLRAAFDEYRGQLDPPSGVHAETRETIRHKLETGHALIAFTSAGAPVGCVFYEAEATHVYLGRLAVLPAYRRHGLGRALIAHVEAWARQVAVPRVQLGVRIALPKLRAYYEGLGYHILSYGTHAGYPEPTFVTMQKNVA